MNILHYTIGLPPTRHGGSVQYAYDLMVEQSKTNNVFALICGDTLFRSSKCRFKRHSQNGNIQIYSLTDPLTPTLIYGVSILTVSIAILILTGRIFAILFNRIRLKLCIFTH